MSLTCQISKAAFEARYLQRAPDGLEGRGCSTFARRLDSVMAVTHRSPFQSPRVPCPTLPAFSHRFNSAGC